MVEEGEVLGGVLMLIACIRAIFGLEKKCNFFLEIYRFYFGNWLPGALVAEGAGKCYRPMPPVEQGA
ncbi:hypothetical protein [uncultured Cohaesibacter sp.]|uniref:hypothetical protein n=1 Tax=uncultured Cohaesibacter sp. TaxID=1002546 RepID=UPI0029C8F8CC|nr:hypothetical protein [uncultured Cohaesibacter sp.]